MKKNTELRNKLTHIWPTILHKGNQHSTWKKDYLINKKYQKTRNPDAQK